MKKVFNYLFSMQMMGILTLLFAFSIGMATFIENDFGTLAARAKVYNAKWFEVLLLLIGINLITNIFRYRLYIKEKWSIFLFHAAFIIILIGAAITRYVGYEGMMHIREGASTNQAISSVSYIDIIAQNSGNSVKETKQVNPFSFKSSNFKTKLDVGGQDISVKLVSFIPNAETSLQEDPTGNPVIDFVAVGKKGSKHAGMHSYTLEYRDSRMIDNLTFDFSSTENQNNVTFSYTDNLRIRAPFAIKKVDMMGGKTELLEEGVFHTLETKTVYDLNGTRILIKNFYPKAKFKYLKGKDEDKLDVLVFNVSNGQQQKELVVKGKHNRVSTQHSVDLDETQVLISFGAKIIELPFSLRLNDFQLDRYPGSNSPSSYASEVTLVDTKNNYSKDQRIFMNNILKYQGFRFYQSAYDREDEKGTILSVNHDTAGMIVTYAGYFLMMLGMLFSIFVNKSRFKTLSRRASEITKGKSITKALILFLLLSGFTPEASAQKGNVELDVVPRKEAVKFGELLIQDNGGRIAPINTFANQIIRKISRKDEFRGYHSDQVFLSMMCNPEKWQHVPMIKISSPVLAEKIGVEGKYAAFMDFLNHQGQYKLSQDVQHASAKKASTRTSYEKDLLKVDERVNISYMVYLGEFLKIFPNPVDENEKWYKPSSTVVLQKEDSLLVKKSIQLYTQALNNKNYTEANELLSGMKNYQAKYGGNILPSALKQKTEIFYNNVNIFKRLFPFYLLIGFLFLCVLVAHVIQPKINIRLVVRITLILLGIGFFLHTMGLAVRWYIAGHAPWSNGFESMVYVAWSSILAGFIFVRKSYFALAATAIISGITLFVAHLSWMSPEITNLVPVLKSYWLTIHVAIITASYGFLALGALLGFINLVLLILKNPDNRIRIDNNIRDLSAISEMTIILGLYFLTAGTILGGIWANESWGRYWGWDPKETWALVTILLYSFVVHLRFIPGLRSVFTFNVASLLAYGSVLMTYFGVNYYLAGLHSYAQGDPVPVPTWVYYAVALIAFVIIAAYFNYRRWGAIPVKEDE